MDDEERQSEHSPELPFQAEGLREYVADIDPATATEMDAVIAQLEHAAETPPEGESPTPR